MIHSENSQEDQFPLGKHLHNSSCDFFQNTETHTPHVPSHSAIALLTQSPCMHLKKRCVYFFLANHMASTPAHTQGCQHASLPGVSPVHYPTGVPPSTASSFLEMLAHIKVCAFDCLFQKRQLARSLPVGPAPGSAFVSLSR